ncbi:hypothetical protein HYW53_00365 [Candidatus Giovannonibacteria bacterium]|nr:hypothetical protein [Candidatus Giovannonibacteria bacterium]
MHGTHTAIQCGLCGTKHPKRDDSDLSYHTFGFLGHQGVVECCGRVVDILFGEWGKEFAEKLLTRFGEAPLEEKFYILRSSIKDAVKKWSIKAAEASADSTEAKIKVS